MQQQFLNGSRPSPERRPSGHLFRSPFLVAVAALALTSCGAGERSLQGVSGVSVADGSVDTASNKVEPITPSSELTSPDDVVVPSFDPNQGEGTPILVTDPLRQPLGIDGVAVADFSEAPFAVQFVASLARPSSLFAFSDYSLVGLVYDDTAFGSLIVKEGVNASPLDFDTIVKAVDDPMTPERYGVDASNGHTYRGVDTIYGTALIEGANGYVHVHFNLADNTFVDIDGVGKLLTLDMASKLASSARFSPTA